MKKFVTIVFLAAAFSATAGAQGLLGGLLGGSGNGSSTLGNIIEGLAGTVYSAPVTLNGNYIYNGVAISATSSEGGVLTNIAGTAVTAGMESKCDEYLAKVGIKPGAMSVTFNSEDNTFVWKVGSLSLPGTYKVGDGERTVTLTFGKTLQYFCMTGTLESASGGAKMLFNANKAVTFLKKVASKMGENGSSLSSLVKMADGYDNFKMGFKLGR